VDALSNGFEVSAETIRRDLTGLESAAQEMATELVGR